MCKRTGKQDVSNKSKKDSASTKIHKFATNAAHAVKDQWEFSKRGATLHKAPWCWKPRV